MPSTSSIVEAEAGVRARPSKTLPPDIRRVLWARSLRAFGDGYVAILLPLHLARLGYDAFGVGIISTATLLGSALLTLAFGLVAYRIPRRRGLLAAGLLMAATGIGFAGLEGFWPLLVIAFVGTLNPSGGDVSIFLPLEHTVIAHVVADEERTAVFARYSFVGAFFGALGALSVGTVDWFAPVVSPSTMVTALFGLYGSIGVITYFLYRHLSPQVEAGTDNPPAPLGPSRGIVYRLAALFSVDAFGGGLVINALLTIWLSERFGIGIATIGAIFFVTSLCSAVSYFAAVPLAEAVWADQHDGVHAPAVEPLPDPDGLRADDLDRVRTADPPQPAVADGRADPILLRHGGGAAGGEACRRERHRRAPEPCVGSRAAPVRMAADGFAVRLAACPRGNPQGCI